MLDDRLDPLAAMTTALRTSTADAPHPVETRRRIVTTLQARRGGAARRLRLLLLTLVGLPFAGSALAFWVGPARFQELVEQLYTTPKSTQVAAAAPAAPKPAQRSQRTAAVDAPAPVEPLATAPAQASRGSDRVVPVGEAAPRQPNVRAAVHAKASSPELRSRPGRLAAHDEPVSPPTPSSLYQQAHQLHFHAQRYEAALPAWDRYLASGPTPRLYVEALYNRAICLVKLGRYSEAQTALRPFAAGAHGHYRQRQASQLLTTLATLQD